jgi:hypothetical protein
MARKLMYRLLRNWLPGPLPQIVMVIWYAVLFLLIVVCSELPDLPFRYLGI